MSKLIYFVDDDRMILHLLEYTFSGRDDYEVKSFRKGEDCLLALNNNPDLIVLDHSYAIPDSTYSTGLQLLGDIRKMNADIPVIILTGEQSADLKGEYQKHNVLQFITKDEFFIDTLIEELKKHFEN